MHGKAAAKLMERGRMLVREAEAKDERDEMIAYLMGVACHFCLDNRVHAYVNADGEADGITHAEIETGVRTETFGAGTYASAAFEPHLPFKDHSPDRAGLIKAFDEDPIKVAKAIMSFRTMNRLLSTRVRGRKGSAASSCVLQEAMGSFTACL